MASFFSESYNKDQTSQARASSKEGAIKRMNGGLTDVYGWFGQGVTTASNRIVLVRGGISGSL